MLAFVGLEEEATLNNGNEGVAMNVGRKFEVEVWSLDVPLLLELGGSFPVICRHTKKYVVRSDVFQG
mgnify:CR=1 FL=1